MLDFPLIQFGKERAKYKRLQQLDAETSSDSDSDAEKHIDTKANGFTDNNMNGGDQHDKLKLIRRQTKTYTHKIAPVRDLATMENEFQLSDAMYFCKSGIEVRSIFCLLM